VSTLRADGWVVDVASRTPDADVDIHLTEGWPSASADRGPYHGIVWAQGINATGSVLETTPEEMHDLYDTNVVFIAQTLRSLVSERALARPSRGVVVSSIWQLTARSRKLAYVASKAALAGLVPAIAIDLAQQKFALNGVLPGVIDTPMTRSQLTPDQRFNIESQSIGGALATPEDVSNAVSWLLSPRANGINGQWIAVDNGWSAVRSV
jgi:NAD(P)-dependent dehydrogenase (short-subunit alcohol dehydrogenase family)